MQNPDSYSGVVNSMLTRMDICRRIIRMGHLRALITWQMLENPATGGAFPATRQATLAARAPITKRRAITLSTTALEDHTIQSANPARYVHSGKVPFSVLPSKPKFSDE
jgi:hypothetical protein